MTFVGVGVLLLANLLQAPLPFSSHALPCTYPDTPCLYCCRWSTFVGVGVLVLATPMTAIFVNIMTNQREQMLMFTDKRIILVNQLLAGMKALKTYAWEAAQEARVRSPTSSTLLLQHSSVCQPSFGVSSSVEGVLPLCAEPC